MFERYTPTATAQILQISNGLFVALRFSVVGTTAYLPQVLVSTAVLLILGMFLTLLRGMRCLRDPFLPAAELRSESAHHPSFSSRKEAAPTAGYAVVFMFLLYTYVAV